MGYFADDCTKLVRLLNTWPGTFWEVNLHDMGNKHAAAVDIQPRVYVGRAGHVVVAPSLDFIADFFAGAASRPNWQGRLYTPPGLSYRQIQDPQLFESELRKVNARWRSRLYVYDVVRDRKHEAMVSVYPEGYYSLIQVGYVHVRMPAECRQSLREFFGRA